MINRRRTKEEIEGRYVKRKKGRREERGEGGKRSKRVP
jgi:hypothetical protein